MRKWLADIRAFTLALVPQTQALITGGVVVAVVTVFSAFGRQLPSWSVVPLLFVALFAAAFTAWREEHNKVTRMLEEKLLAECAELLRSGSYPLNALMLTNADELPTNEDVVRLCEDLAMRGFTHPFDVDVIGGSLLPLKDLWLTFLKEARFRGYKLQGSYEVERVRAQLLDQNFALWINSEAKCLSPSLQELSVRKSVDRKVRIDAFVDEYYTLCDREFPHNGLDILLLFRRAGVLELRSDDEIEEAIKDLSTTCKPTLFEKYHFESGVQRFFETVLPRDISFNNPEQVEMIFEDWFGKPLPQSIRG